MNKFLLKIFLLGAILLAFIVVAEILLRSTPTSYSILHESFNRKSKEINTLFIGSSGSQRAISPSEMKQDSSFNLSNVSQTIYYSTELVSKNLDKMDQLKLVVFCPDPIMMFLNDNCFLDKWREKFYYKYWGLNPEYSSPDLLWNLQIGLYDNKTIVNTCFNRIANFKTINEIDAYGWESCSSTLTEISNDQKMDNAKFRVDIHCQQTANDSVFIGGKLKLNCENNLMHINKLIAKLKSKNIKLVIIQTPLSKYYLKYLPDEILKYNKRIFEKIAIDNNIPYYSFIDDSSYVDEYFGDVTHLNTQGAKKFSHVISKVLEP
jgi:hypothetical protein